MSKYDVFISYSRSHNDRDIVRNVSHFLQVNDIGCFLDYSDVGVGEEWAETIINAMIDASVVIVILNERYINSPSCNNEIELAVKYDKPIIPLKVDDSDLSNEKTRLLHNYNWIIINHQNEWKENLLKAIKYHLHNDTVNDWISDEGSIDTPNLGYLQLKTKTKRERPQRSKWKVTLIGNKKDKDAILKVSSYVPGNVYLDGEFICEIGKKEIVIIPLNQGAYIVSLEEKNNPQSYKMIGVDIPAGSHSKALVVGFQSSEGTKESVRKTNKNKEEVKCFIAGSKEMMDERNAMRAVASSMYLKWKSFNFLIEVYSFDNFDRTMSETGHQEEYNQFIANEADLVLFIFDNKVGDISLKELDIAIDSYKKNKRPQIIVYVKKDKKYSRVIEDLKKRLAREDVYWVDYICVEHLARNFERDLNALLFRRVHIE